MQRTKSLEEDDLLNTHCARERPRNGPLFIKWGTVVQCITDMPKLSTVSKNLDSADAKVWRLIEFNPAGFSEYLRSTKRERFRLWPSQYKEMNREANRKKKIQARRLGKSLNATDEVIDDVLRYRGNEIGIALIGSRGQPTLQYIFERFLISQFQRNRFLNFFLEPGDRGFDRKNYEIRLRDGSTIKGRIQGKDGQGFQTVHPTIVSWFDEVQLLSDAAVSEIYGMLAPTDKVIATGVPNGFRGSWAYKIDTNPKMNFIGDRVTRLDDPTMTEDDIEQLKLAYGGEHTAAYKSQVLGEWGAPSSMTFDVDRIVADLPYKEDEYPKLPPYYTDITIHARDYMGAGNLPVQLLIKQDMPKTAQKIYIHADHGSSSDPTIIYVSFFDAKEGARVWRQYMRVVLKDMQAPAQVEIFHYLADTLEHMFKMKPVIGMDTTGGGGKAVMDFLEKMNHTLVWVNFSEGAEFGTRLETDEEYMTRMRKDPLGNPERLEVPMKSPMKQIAIPTLKRYMYSGELRVVNQPELWKQLENTTDSEIVSSQDRKYVTDYNGPEGDRPGYDHDLAAFEVLGAMLHHDIMAPEIEAYRDMWIEPFETPWGRFER